MVWSVLFQKLVEEAVSSVVESIDLVLEPVLEVGGLEEHGLDVGVGARFA